MCVGCWPASGPTRDAWSGRRRPSNWRSRARPAVIAADANTALPDLLTGLPPGAPAVIVTTWAFAYFSLEDRQEFIALLDAASLQRDIAWLSAEGPGTVEPLSVAVAAHPDPSGSDILGAVLFTGGAHRAEFLGLVGAHGAWIDWRAGRAKGSAREQTGDRRHLVGVEPDALSGQISLRWARLVVPGMGKVTAERCSCQARAICDSVTSWCRAIGPMTSLT